MARLTIPNEKNWAGFDVAEASSEFPFAFSLFGKDDLRVKIGAAVLDQSGYTLVGTLLDGGGYKGGRVVLNQPVQDVRVLISRSITPQRAEGFGQVASVPVRAVDQAFNRVTAVQQDLDQRTELLKTLPEARLRRETIPIFDRDGSLTTAPAVQVLNSIGLTFEDDGFWGASSEPLTFDDGAFV